MRYLIIGGFTLMAILLVSKIFLALDFVRFDTYSSKSKAPKSPERELKIMGKQIYLVYCSSCHGSNGEGNNGKAQNHTNRISKKSVLDVIQNGSNNFNSLYPAGMPAGLIDGDDAKTVALYVASGFQGEKPKAWETCATCHNKNGEGIPFIAPNIKTYSDELVATVLTNGKKGAIGTMPNFKERLSEVQVKALATYIRSIAK